MASSKDEDFKRSCHAITTAAAAPESQLDAYPNGGLERGPFVRRIVEKRGVLNFDLNVAPPEDGESESPAGGNGGEIRSTAAVDVASNFNGDCENGNRIRSHCSKGENNEEKEMKTANTIGDSDVKMEKKERRIRGWNTLLEVAEDALREHEENLKNNREASQESELGGELNGGATRKKITRHRRQGFAAEWNDETAAAAAVVVVRSTRGRAVAMPNKYRDSILDAVAVAEAEFSRHNKSGNSATVVSTKRKCR